MNANELADELENALDEDSWCQECALENTDPVARQAATMLRQQQAEIEALKKFNKAILKKGGCDGNICQQYSTHPVKELTDEEILEIITEVSAEQGLVWLGDKVIFPFARAILKRAQQ